MNIISLKDVPETTTIHNAAGKKRQLIAPGTIPHLVQFAQVTFRPGEVATEHKHEDFSEIFLVESGNGVIRINGKQSPVEKGMCITVEPNELHEVTNTGEDDLVLTYFAIQK